MKDKKSPTERLEEILRSLGFTRNEAKILSLLTFSERELTAREISENSGVPRPKVYPSLKSLEERGLVRVVGSRPLTFVSIPPRELPYKVIDLIMGEITETLEELADLLDVDLTLGLWLLKGGIYPISGSKQILKASKQIIRDIRGRITLILPGESAKLIRGVVSEIPPFAEVHVLIEDSESGVSESIIEGLGGLKTRRVQVKVGRADPFMIVTDGSGLIADRRLNRGVVVSDDYLLASLRDLAHYISSLGRPLRAKGYNGI